MAVLARAQIAEQAGLDLDSGLIPFVVAQIQDSGTITANVSPDAQRQFSNLTLCFAADIKLDRQGANAEVIRLPSDKPEIIVSIGEGGSISLVHGSANDRLLKIERAINQSGRHSIALVIKRDARQALSGLWIDGVECASFPVAPGTWDLYYHNIVLNGGGTCDTSTTGTDVRLYNRALTRPEVIALANLHHAPAATHTIALIGSTEAVLMAESGWMDAYLALKSAAAPNAKRIAMRNLAWEGDTVWRQDRPLNFGPLEQQLDRVQAQQVVIMLGRQECIERGEAGLDDFRRALEALVAKCPRGALLMGCVPFEAKPPPQRDLSALNAVLSRYDDAIKAVAEARGGTFFDTRKSWRKQEEAWTRDGLTLNARGEWLLGDVTAFALGLHGSDPGEAEMRQLRTLAQAKEQLWHRYWRPSNWAFLYGDRTTQPSSRDHLNPSVRWFPQELEQYRTLITEKENELWKQAEAIGRKLP